MSRALLDFDAYPERNPFVILLTTPAPREVGSTLHLRVPWAGGRERDADVQDGFDRRAAALRLESEAPSHGGGLLDGTPGSA